MTGENRSIGRKTCAIATLSAITITWTGLGSNPCLRGDTPATNHLSRGREDTTEEQKKGQEKGQMRGTVMWAKKRIVLLEGTQVYPVRPSDSLSRKIKPLE
jgi:hypothetical protein